MIEQRVVEKKQELKVLLIGKLDNPKIKCLRQLYHNKGESLFTPLAIKVTGAVQKFRIPFKNMSDSLDAEVEF